MDVIADQPGSKLGEAVRSLKSDSKERLLQFGREFVSEPGSTNLIITHYKGPIGMEHIRPSARRISSLFTLDEAKPAQRLFLRSIFGEPSFRRKPSRLDAELTRCDKRSRIGAGLSATDDLL